MELFCDRLKRLLQERGISANQFEVDTGIARRILCRSYERKIRRASFMAIAYYLDMRVEDLIADSTAEDHWYA